MSDQTNENKPRKPKKVPIPLKLIVGAVSGVFGSSLMFSIYLVKTRLQAFPGKYNGPIDCFQQIIRTEGGFKALYSGLKPNLLGVAPEKAIKLAVNEHLRERFENDDGSINLPYEILAGGSAGFCQVIITNPMEITVIRMQVQATLPESQQSTMINVVRNLGIKGLFTGTLTTLTRDVPFSILFFPVYANLKSALAYKEGEKKGQNSIPSQLLAGGAAGAFAAGSVTPADVVKTRLQLVGGIEKYKNMPGAFKLIFKEEGFLAFYKGAIPRMVVFGPLFAITLLAFEAQKEYMARHGLL